MRRDHLISHLLGALSSMPNNKELVFFGGTALARTLLPDLRLSEDIDLIALSNRTLMASSIMNAFEGRLARSHGEIEWMPGNSLTRKVLMQAGARFQWLRRLPPRWTP